MLSHEAKITQWANGMAGTQAQIWVMATHGLIGDTSMKITCQGQKMKVP